jgi:hypothetical protein
MITMMLLGFFFFCFYSTLKGKFTFFCSTPVSVLVGQERDREKAQKSRELYHSPELPPPPKPLPLELSNELQLGVGSWLGVEMSESRILETATAVRIVSVKKLSS